MEEYTNYLAHHGVKGMRWGVRRYQNTDGSLTDSGRKHYGVKTKRKEKIKKGLKVAGAGAAVVGAAAGGVAGITTAKRKIASRPQKPFKENSMFDRSIKRGKDKEKDSPAERLTREAGNVIDDTKSAYTKTKKAIQREKVEAERQKYARKVQNMSNEELQTKIRRLELENRYINLSSPSYDVGRDRVDDVLDIMGPVVSLAGSAAAIGTTIYGLKKLKAGA